MAQRITRRSTEPKIAGSNPAEVGKHFFLPANIFCYHHVRKVNHFTQHSNFYADKQSLRNNLNNRALIGLNISNREQSSASRCSLLNSAEILLVVVPKWLTEGRLW